MALHAYRFFGTDCRDAMTHYQGIFGGHLDIMGFGDMPPGEDAPPDVDPRLVMHAALTFPNGDLLMASDDPTGDGGPMTGISIHYTADSIDDGDRIFAALADGGQVDMPFEPVFWAQRFGGCVDKFGTSWMVSVDHPTT